MRGRAPRGTPGETRGGAWDGTRGGQVARPPDGFGPLAASEYAPADRPEPVRRFKAWAADLAVVGLVYWLLLAGLHAPLSALLALVSEPEGPRNALLRLASWPLTLPGRIAFGPEAARAQADSALLVVLFVWLSAAYHASLEALTATTLRATYQGIRPRGHPNPRAALWRAAARPLDGLLLGLVGLGSRAAFRGRPPRGSPGRRARYPPGYPPGDSPGGTPRTPRRRLPPVPRPPRRAP